MPRKKCMHITKTLVVLSLDLSFESGCLHKVHKSVRYRHKKLRTFFPLTNLIPVFAVKLR
jgi:hypothetical protein